jgi:hypothetical protein
MKKGFLNYLMAAMVLAMFSFGFTSCNSGEEGDEEGTEETTEGDAEGSNESEGSSESSSNGSSAVVGEWVGSNIEITSDDMTDEEKEMMNSMMAEMASMIEMTFNEDGTASMSDPNTGGVNTGTYTMNDDNMLVLTDDASGETTDFEVVTMDASTLVLAATEEGMGTVTITLVPKGSGSASAE